MTRVTAKFGTATLLAIATGFVSFDVARAAGPFDGNWVLSAGGAGRRRRASVSRFPHSIPD